MKQKGFQKFISVLLALVLTLGLALPAMAADGSGEQGSKLSFEQVSADEYNVGLSRRDEVSTEETEEPLYEDTDIVRVSIVLEDASTLEKGFTADEIAAFSSDAMAYRQSLKGKQEAMEATISRQALDGEDLDVVWNLTLAANIISANVEYGDISAIEAVPGVEEVLVERRYEPCVVKEELTTDPMMSTSDEMIGSTAVWASGYTGAGRKIAIIDTGIDVDHPALDPDALAYALEGSNASLMTSADTAKVLSQLNAAKQYKGLTAEDLYVNAKIPFGFNYVDNGLNIGHDKDTQGDHGSHVAGIAAANRYVKAEDGSFESALDATLTQGVAPDAQLLVMKVFGVTGGASESDYMAAVEDAMVLGADSANLSLGGSWTGNSRAADAYAAILERVTKSGMVVVISAGNSGSWYEETAVGSAYADGVSFATSGAPGTYTNSLGVASVDNVGQTGLYIDVAGNKMFYTESLESQSGSKYTNLSITTLAGEQEYVYLDSIGTAEEFAAIKDVLAGKIAICNRGELNFTDKLENAVSNGAIATIVANNQPGTLGMELSAYTRTEPAVTISQADAATLKAASTPVTDDSGKVLYYTGKLTISDAVGSGVSAADHYTMSSFSSWGVPGSLELKPEITAPGGNIYSLKNGGAYQNMSGTSMAAPQVTGMVALLDQYLEEQGYPAKTGLSTRVLAQSLLMSTAEPISETDTTYYPVLRQGAGLANIQNAISAGSYLLMDADATGSYADGKIKAELGDDPDRSGTYSFGFTIYNLEDTATAFRLSADFFTQALAADSNATLYEDTVTAPLPATLTWTVDGKPLEAEIPASALACDLNGDGTVNTQDGQALLDYVTGVRSEINDRNNADLDHDGDIDTYDAYLFFRQVCTASVSVPANGSVHVQITASLNKAQLDMYDDYSDGTGTYVEGYVFASELSDAEGSLGVTHSIPVLGYYGSWTDGSMFDVGSYIDYFVSGEEARPPYMFDNTEKSLQYQVLSTREKGSANAYAFGGNPYVKEDFYEPERDSINTDTSLLNELSFTAIRNFSNSHLRLTDSTGNTYLDTDTGANEGAYYQETAVGGLWRNVQYTITIGTDLSKAPEGATLGLSLTLAPEYYVEENGTTHWDALGAGATQTYHAYVDKTAPTLSDVTLIEDVTTGDQALAVTASDNRYIATVALIDYDTGNSLTSGSTPAGSPAGHEDVFRIELDEAMKAASHLLVAVYDYAGNHTTYKINRNTQELEGSVSVTLSETTLSLFRGANATLTAEVSPFGVQPDGVDWSSSNEAVATVSPEGLVTGTGEGKAVITAASRKDPSAKATCEITVKVLPVTLYGTLQDENALAQLYTWDLAHESRWTARSALESETVAATAYDSRNSTVYLVDSQKHSLHKVDPATGKDLATYDGVPATGGSLPVWDLAYSDFFSTEDKPLLTGVYGIYILPLTEPENFSGINKSFEDSYALGKTGASRYLTIAAMGHDWVTPVWNTVEGEIYALLDDAGYIHIGVFCDEEEEGALSYTGWDWFESTLPELNLPGSDSDMYCSMVATEENGASVLYLTCFTGETNEIYRLTFTSDGVPARYNINDDNSEPKWDANGAEHLWVAEYAGTYGDGVWPANIYQAVPNTPETTQDVPETTQDIPETTEAAAETAPVVTEAAVPKVSLLSAPAGLTSVTSAADVTIQEAPVEASASNISVSEDEKTVTVNVVAQGDEDLTNGLATVEYDASLLTLTDVSMLADYTSHKDEAGKVTLGYVSLDGVPAGTVIATLTFQVDPAKVDADLTVTVHHSEANDAHVDSTETLTACFHKETVIGPAKAPTCTENGTSGDTLCAVCGKKLADGQVTPATGHKFGEWASTKDATCTETGTESRTCSVCGATETRETPALGHDYKNGTCTRCGAKLTYVNTGDTVNIPLLTVLLTCSAAAAAFVTAVLLRKKRVK